MRKHRKNTLLGLLCAASVLCAGFGAGTIATKYAKAEEVIDETPPVVETCSICGGEKHETALCTAPTANVNVGGGETYTKNGMPVDMTEYALSSDALKIDTKASIRLASLDGRVAAGVDYSALRFRVLMKSETRELMQENFWKDQDAWEMGILVIPVNVLGKNASGEQELTLETQKANKLEIAGYHWQPAEGVDGYEQVVYNLYNMPEYDEIYLANMCARAYVKYIDKAAVKAGATEEEATTIFYTNTYQVSMTDVATKYVKTCEGEDVYNNLDAVREAELIEEANNYRPDMVLSYRDGLKYEKATAQYGDVVSVNNSRESGIVYSGKGVWTLPKNSGTSYWEDPVTHQKRTYLEDGVVLNDLESVQHLIDHDFKVLYVNGNIALSSPIDLETSRSTAQPLGEVPFEKTIRSITITPKDAELIQFTNLPLASISPYLSISQHDGKSLVLDNSNGDFYDPKTNSITIPAEVTALDTEGSIIDSYHDYGYARFDITIVAGGEADPADVATYRTEGGLYSKKIYSAQDLLNWQEVAKTDYLDVFSRGEAGATTGWANGGHRTKESPLFRHEVDARPDSSAEEPVLSRWMTYALKEGKYSSDSAKVILNDGSEYLIVDGSADEYFVKPDGKERGMEITNPKPIEFTTESYAQHRWGGYFVLGADIDMNDLAQGEEYKDTINAVTLSEGAGNGRGLTVGIINGRQYGFTGTFDGNGYTIDNFTQSSKYGAFIGQLMSLGEIKNISFTNAKQTEIGGFVVSSGCGIVHDIYVHFAPDGRKTLAKDAQEDITAGNKASWAKAGSSVFYSLDNMNEARVYNCVINATDDSDLLGAANSVNYDATLSHTHGHYGVLNNVYMIGGNYTSPVKINTTNSGTGAANYIADVYGGYETYNDFLNAKKSKSLDFSTWAETGIWRLSKEITENQDGSISTELKWVDTGFWRLTADDLPYPAHLGAPEIESVSTNYIKGALVSNYYGTAKDVYKETGSRFAKLVVDETIHGTGSYETTTLTTSGRGIKIPFGCGGSDIEYKVVNPYDPALTATTLDTIPENQVLLSNVIDVRSEGWEHYELETAFGVPEDRLTFETDKYDSFPKVSAAYIFNGDSTINVDVNTLTVKTATPGGGGNVRNKDRSVFWVPMDSSGELINKTFVTSIEGYPVTGYTAPSVGGINETLRVAFEYRDYLDENGNATNEEMIHVLGAAPIETVTHEINTALELQGWLNIAKYYGSVRATGNANIPYPVWDGYFVLGNDIDMDGLRYNGTLTINESTGEVVEYPQGLQKPIMWATLAESTTYNGVTQELYKFSGAPAWHRADYMGFTGTFDGKQQAIYNYDSAQVIAGGFIGLLNASGKIRNLSFVNSYFGGASGFLTHTTCGTIDNVYIHLFGTSIGGLSNPSGVLFAADKTEYYSNGTTNGTIGTIQNGGMTGGKISNVFINAMASDIRYDYYKTMATESGSAVASVTTYNAFAIGGNMSAGTLSNVYMAGGYGPSFESAWGRPGNDANDTTRWRDASGNWINMGPINGTGYGAAIIGSRRLKGSIGTGTITNVDYISAPLSFFDGLYYSGFDFSTFENTQGGAGYKGIFIHKADNGLAHGVYFPGESNGVIPDDLHFKLTSTKALARQVDGDGDYDVTDKYLANLYAYRRWKGYTNYTSNYSSFWTTDRCGVPVPKGNAKRWMDWRIAAHYLVHTNCNCTDGHDPIA